MFGSRCCLDGFWIHLKESMMLHYDNQNSIKLSNNLMFHMRTKHVEIQHHFMSEKIIFGEINVKHIATQDQIGDILMKPLGKIKLAKLKSEMGIYAFNDMQTNCLLGLQALENLHVMPPSQTPPS